VRFIALLVLAIVFCSPGLVGAQSRLPANDLDLVHRTSLELIRLTQRGNGNELYDWLSDSSRDRIPRDSFAQWVDLESTFVPVGDPDVTSITFEEWLWPVTGVTYPNVATVIVTQAGTRLGIGLSKTSTYHLLNDGTRWRWLYGDSIDDVNAIVDQPISELSYASEYASEPYRTIDSFWADIFADVGLEYEPVFDVVAVNTMPYQTGCGTESAIDAAGVYLCLLDRTIYYSPALKTMILAEYGDIGWHTIIAHEWSHEIQSQIGIHYENDPELEDGAYILELETQADCMTGLYMQSQLGQQSISRQDLQESRRILATYGDLEMEDWDDPVAHGTGQQRVASFNIGFHSGFVGCGLDLDRLTG